MSLNQQGIENVSESVVLVENEYYDGPRTGITILHNTPYRFISDFDNNIGYLDTFSLIPISNSELELEIEQWRIFVDWNNDYESGKVASTSHPGHGGISPRWDEIEKCLQRPRKDRDGLTLKATAEFKHNGQAKRYDHGGPCYTASWTFLHD